MSEERPKRAPPPGGPPKLERVPEGYKAPSVRPPAPGLPQSTTTAPGGAAPRPPAPTAPPQPSYGMSAREVGADAAIAAGLAHQGSLAAESAIAVFGLAAAM